MSSEKMVKKAKEKKKNKNTKDDTILNLDNEIIIGIKTLPEPKPSKTQKSKKNGKRKKRSKLLKKQVKRNKVIQRNIRKKYYCNKK